MQSGSLERTVLRTVAVLIGAALETAGRQAAANRRAIRIFDFMASSLFGLILTPFTARPLCEACCGLTVELREGRVAAVRIQCWPSQASARARRKTLSRTLRVSVAAALNSERASASRPARNRKSPLAAGKGA